MARKRPAKARQGEAVAAKSDGPFVIEDSPVRVVDRMFGQATWLPSRVAAEAFCAEGNASDDSGDRFQIEDE